MTHGERCGRGQGASGVGACHHPVDVSSSVPSQSCLGAGMMRQAEVKAGVPGACAWGWAWSGHSGGGGGGLAWV
jgi:hypothetical protein